MKLITTNLVHDLQQLSDDATHIAWVTAFAMKSGVQLMLPTLQRASEQQCTIQLLIGDYLAITQPDALELLLTELPHAELRLYETYGQAFHPKAYLFQHRQTQHVIVGSSNLSKSAMTAGIEWNLHTVDATTFEHAVEEFQQLFYAPQTVPLNTMTLAQYRERYERANTVRPLSNAWNEADETTLMYGATSTHVSYTYEHAETLPVIAPRPAQQLALQALYETVTQGYSKALVVLATGLGKTFLAAFFAQRYKRILFVAHRDEILQQAHEAFSLIYPERTRGYFHRTEKNTTCDIVFASIYTLSMPTHLHKFDARNFDLIIVDEFHHAVAPTYQRLLQHFSPQFLLGITATPERTDNKDVYALCDGNVAIEIHFLDAISKQWLSPFQYYGVRDRIDYRSIRWLGTKYDEQQLIDAQQQHDVAHAIFQKWQMYKQSQTIGFCSSVAQARYLAHYFSEQGVHARALTGTDDLPYRQHIRQQLRDGTIDIIFTVDLFNEGVDIPTVDTLLFVRPTESLTIYTQQIGRGLRLAEGKSHCVIIDFIGNYRNAERKLRLFYPNLQPTESLSISTYTQIDGTACTLQFDLEVIDLIEEMTKKQQSYRQQIIDAFSHLQADLGTRPSYLHMHLYSGFRALNLAKEFGGYFAFLHAIGQLSPSEQHIYETYAALLKEIEKTAMTKSYKMVLLRAMLLRGETLWHTAIEASEVAPYFSAYLQQAPQSHIDVIDHQPSKVRSLIKRMPMSTWAKSSKGLVQFDGTTFSFTSTIATEHQAVLYDWVQQICAFRLHTYFEKKSI